MQGCGFLKYYSTGLALAGVSGFHDANRTEFRFSICHLLSLRLLALLCPGPILTSLWIGPLSPAAGLRLTLIAQAEAT